MHQFSVFFFLFSCFWGLLRFTFREFQIIFFLQRFAIIESGCYSLITALKTDIDNKLQWKVFDAFEEEEGIRFRVAFISTGIRKNFFVGFGEAPRMEIDDDDFDF